MAGKATSARGQIDSLYGQFLEAQNHNQTIANTETATGEETPGATGIKMWNGETYTGDYYTGADGSQWAYLNPDQPNLLTNLGNGRSWASMAGDANAPSWMQGVMPTYDSTSGTWTLTPLEQISVSPNGAGGYGASQRAASFSDYLTSPDGSDVQNAYNEAVAAARREYDFNRATFGARGEQLGRAGLTGSGYGDYLEGKAFSAMASGVAQAETARAKSYADYLTQKSLQASSYAAYLAGEEEAATQKHTATVNAIVSTGYKNAGEGSAITREWIIEQATQSGVTLSEEDIQGIITRFANLGVTVKTQAEVNATNEQNAANERAARIDAIVAEYSKADYSALTPEELKRAVALNLNNMSDEEWNDISSRIQTKRAAQDEEQATIEAEQAAAQRDAIIDGMVLKALEDAGENGFVTKERLDEIANQNNVDVDEQMMEEIEKRLNAQNVRVKTNAQIYEENATVAVNEMGNVSDLISTYSSDAVEKFINMGVDETEIDAYRAAASERIAEILLSAYDDLEEDDMLGIAKLIYGENATVEMLGENQDDAGGALVRAAKDAYDKGAMAYEDIKLVTDKVVEETLKNVDDPDKLVQLANTLTILKGESDFTSLYQGYMNRMAEKLQVVNITVDEDVFGVCVVKIQISANEPKSERFYFDFLESPDGWGYMSFPITEEEKKTGNNFAFKNGHLCVRNGKKWSVIGSNPEVGDTDEKDQKYKTIYDLLVRKVTDPYDENVAQAINQAKQSYTPESITDSVSKPKSSYAGYLTGQS